MFQDIKTQILEFLKENSRTDFSILEISNRLTLSWNTTSKYVEILTAEGKVTMIDRGSVKLVRANE